MENEKNNPQPEDSAWLEDWLKDIPTETELGPDESAISGAGLTDISDMELEKIIQETVSGNWEDPAEPAPEAEAPVEETPFEEFPIGEFPVDEFPVDSEDPAFPPDLPDEEEETVEEGPVRKVRPKRKTGYGLFAIPHLLSTAIWAAIAIFIGISFGRLLWVCAADVLAFGREDKTVTVTITASDNLESVAEKFHNAGLIKYKQLFMLYGQITNMEEDGEIVPGTYELNTLFDYHALAIGIAGESAIRIEVEVMIPEGYTCAQIFELLEEKEICKAEELERYAETSQFASYWFLEGMQRGHKYCLEGFLFPDTYKFYTNDTPQRIFHKMLSRFGDQFDEEMVAGIDALNERLVQMFKRNGYSEDYANAQKLTVYEVVIIASMIEKETANSGESPDIASVIYNRLTNPGEYPYLNIDATVVYALDGKTDLTKEDLQVDHPYNTYVYKGLTPGPISNPGVLSLKSALKPSDEKYYYYALDPATGEHHFSKTYKEHQDFLATLG